MPTVEFKIANHTYELACADGEQERIRNLARGLNTRVESLAKTFSSASHSMILAITALMMEDEIRTLKEDKGIPVVTPADRAQEAANQNDAINLAVAEAIEPIAQTIEMLANKLEQ